MKVIIHLHSYQQKHLLIFQNNIFHVHLTTFVCTIVQELLKSTTTILYLIWTKVSVHKATVHH